jgi:RhoGAP domain
LSTLFDTPPAFGEGMSLRAESTADICALLLTYLKELPEPVLTPYLFNAFWNWSVRPSVKREDERMRKEQDEEEDLRTRFFQTGQRPPRPSRRVLYEKARLREAQDETAETGQVTVARDLLRLLPTHSFSLIIYLCAFFTQVPLCPENGITFEDIGRIFGPPVFGGPVPAARRMMVWFLKRWNRVSDGLLDADPNSDDSEAADGTTTVFSPPHLLRRDMRNQERADSLELLAPEEHEEDELVDFRASLTDSADTDEGHEYHYQSTSLRREHGNAGVMTTQEMARASRRKGPTGPDDRIVMQVPSRDHGHSSEPYCVFPAVRCLIAFPLSSFPGPECIEEEALSPQHSFAPTSHRESRIRRSPERGFSGEPIPNRGNI